MSHARQQIRDYIASILLGLPSTAERVYVGRTRALPADKATGFQPLALRVYTTNDDAQNQSTNFPSTQLHQLTIRIEGSIITDKPPDDLLDQCALEVEQKMNLDPKFGHRLKSLSAAKFTSAVEAKGDKHDGAFRLEYVGMYSVKQNAPDVLV